MSTINKTIDNFPEDFSSGNLKCWARGYNDNLQSICKKVLGTVIGTNITCKKCAKYRSINGVCNNLNTITLGAAGIAMRRFIPPAYADGKLAILVMQL